MVTPRRTVHFGIMVQSSAQGDRDVDEFQNQVQCPVDVFRVERGETYTTAHYRALHHHANCRCLFVLATAPCVIEESADALSMRIWRYDDILSRERSDHPWFLVNLAPVSFCPMMWVTSQRDLYLAATHGMRLVLFNMTIVSEHLNTVDPEHWRPPMYVEGWLAVSGSGRICCWPPVASGGESTLMDTLNEFVTVVFGVVLPSVTVATLAMVVAGLMLSKKKDGVNCTRRASRRTPFSNRLCRKRLSTDWRAFPSTRREQPHLPESESSKCMDSQHTRWPNTPSRKSATSVPETRSSSPLPLTAVRRSVPLVITSAAEARLCSCVL